LEELDKALARIDLRNARKEGKITLGSGAAAGTYHAFGKALSQYAEQQEIALFSAGSQGSVENASRLQAGRIDFGLVQGDVAQLLYQGLITKGFYPYKELRAVASLWPEAVHLLTLESTGIRHLSELKGRRIAIGQRGSGSRVNAMLIALVADIEDAQLPDIRELSLPAAISQLEAGEVDAVFLTEAVPAPAVQALAARRPDLRFVPMPPDLFVRLSQKGFVYYPLTVKARSYPGQEESFTTLGLAAMLMTHRQVPGERVETMLNLLVSGVDALSRRYYRAAFISPETMRFSLDVPLHPAAQAFFARYDLTVEDAPED
jgi:TRAP transporter TAXI family solute receptor